MAFVDELYKFYKDQLSGDEVDAEIIAASILDELSRDDLLSLLKELHDDELYGLFGLYLIENLKERMAREGSNRDVLPSDPLPKLIH
ncbi:DUF6154 family protein [Bacillus songklensis]|uniref:DUF6154 family protein n=1 Tax=Bacillus songklensis TaxID=1069116 RepID=A0ABV8B783_9BACI